MEDIEALTTGLEGVPVAAIVSNLATGEAISANLAAADLLGTPVDALVGEDVVAYVHPAERSAASSGVAALASAVVDAFQVRQRRVIRNDGSDVFVDISGRRLESGGTPLALWVLTPPEEHLEIGHAVRSADVLFALTDHDWQIEYVSSDAHLLGTSGPALVGMSLLGFIHPLVAAEFLEATSRAVEHRIAVTITTRLRSEQDSWTTRDCLVVPMCGHNPPRLGIVVTAVASVDGEMPPAGIAAQVHHAVVATRAADALDTLAAISRRPDFPDLSSRQVEILSRVLRGDPVDAIAAALYLSPSTVRNHLTALYRKFGVHSRAELLADLLRTSLPLKP